MGKRLRTVTDSDGIRQTVEVSKRVKPLWFSQNSKVFVQLRYGSKVVPLTASSHAMLLLGKMYDEKNVISVTHIKLDEQVKLVPIPHDIKHERIIRDLTNKITNYANRLRPSQHDMNIALKRYRSKQKRVNLELEKQQHLNMLRGK